MSTFAHLRIDHTFVCNSIECFAHSAQRAAFSSSSLEFDVCVTAFCWKIAFHDEIVNRKSG